MSFSTITYSIRAILSGIYWSTLKCQSRHLLLRATQKAAGTLRCDSAPLSIPLAVVYPLRSLHGWSVNYQCQPDVVWSHHRLFVRDKPLSKHHCINPTHITQYKNSDSAMHYILPPDLSMQMIAMFNRIVERKTLDLFHFQESLNYFFAAIWCLTFLCVPEQSDIDDTCGWVSILEYPGYPIVVCSTV